MEKVVATGDWMSDGKVATLVRIVQLDYDFWYAVGAADDELELDEAPVLNDQGFLFYVRHKPGWSEGQSFWPDGPGFMTEEEARAAAEATVPSPIRWR